MKLSFALIALVNADSQAPLISLNLDGTPGTASSMAARHVAYNSQLSTLYNGADKDHTGTGQAKVSNSFADECEFASACQEPQASAYDHHDGDISSGISTVYRLFVESDPKKVPVKVDSSAVGYTAPATVDITQRGEWVITYDVADTAGNSAEQVQFALIIIDTVAPVFDTNYAPSATTATKCTSKATCAGTGYIKSDAGSNNVEIELCGPVSGSTAAYYQMLTTGTRFQSTDNYDGTLTEANSDMAFTVAAAGVAQVKSIDYKFDSQLSGVTTAVVYDYTLTSADFADIFGSSNANNVATDTGTVTLTDTIIPTIVQPEISDFECGYNDRITDIRTTKATQYTDCYDDYTTIKNDVDVKVSCTPVATLVEGWYGQGLVNADNGAIETCLGSVAAEAGAVSEGAYTVDATSIVTAGQNKAGNAMILTAGVPGTTLKPAYTITLTYSVTDKFGLNAADVTRTVEVKDTIAPTLYITKAAVRTAGYTNNAGIDGGSHTVAGGERCIHQAATDTKGSSYTDGTSYDTTQEHCVQTHRDGSETQDHMTASSSNAYTSEVVIQHSAGYANDYTFVQELMQEGTGYGCYDICSSTTTTTKWVETCNHGVTGASDATKEFNMLKPGTYYLKYECTDESSNLATSCRTFINVDKTRPVITILAAANKADGIWYVEASRDNNYVDAGATCSDMVDGNISQDVEVSGDVVNMAAVGTYKINYNCEDSAGQTAIQATRTVVVEDTTCPTCKIPGGSETITVEASFPYTEEASTCTDTLDGAMPNAHIYGTVDVESTGEYVLTYSVTDKNGNGATPSVCTLSDTNNGNHFTKTVVVEDTMVPIISLKYRGNNLVGMMAESTTTTVNGWVIGAVASAVSGVALLGYAATRKATVATSVPV